MERVSKAQAVKLNQFGCNLKANRYYDITIDSESVFMRVSTGDIEPNEDYISAPYLDEVIDWLDGKEIYLVIGLEDRNHWYCNICEGVGASNVYYDKASQYLDRTAAKSAGIDKALDILSQQNSKNG